MISIVPSQSSRRAPCASLATSKPSPLRILPLAAENITHPTSLRAYGENILVSSAAITSLNGPGIWRVTKGAESNVDSSSIRLWDMDVVGDRIAVVGDEGALYFGKLHLEEDKSLRGLFNKHDLDKSLSHARLCQGGKVVCAFADCLTLESSKGSLQTIHRWEYSSFRVSDLQWSPLKPNIVAACLQGTNSNSPGYIEIFDIRAQKEHMTIPYSVSMTSALGWNPFLPYWLACSNHDGISIYDIRYFTSNPALTLPCPRPASFSWSNSHCELMMVASAGRTASLWSLVDCTKKTINSHSNLGGIIPSTKEMNVFHGVSLLGKVVKMDFNEMFLDSIVPHQFEAKSSEYDIERHLYKRDLEQVHHALLAYSNTTYSNDYQQLLAITKQTQPRDAIAADSWTVGSLHDPKWKCFRDDLFEFCHSLPPGFKALSSECLEENDTLMDAIELIRLKVKVLELLDGSLQVSCKGILQQVAEALHKSPEFLGADHLARLVALLASEDRLAALKFTKSTLDRDQSNGGRLENSDCRILHVLLYPTIFDEQAAKLIVYRETLSNPLPGSRTGSPVKKQLSKAFDDSSHLSLGPPPIPELEPNTPTSPKRNRPALPSYEAPSSLVMMEMRKCIRSLKHATSMIELEIKLEEALSLEEQIKILWSEMTNAHRTISVNVIWPFLEDALEKTRMDVYFSFIGRLCRDAAVAPALSQSLLDHMERVVMPRFKYVLSQALETHRPSLVLKALLLIALIVDGIRPLSIPLRNYLLDKIRSLLRIMESEDYTKLSSYPTFATYVLQMNVPLGGEDDDELWAEFAHLQSMLVSDPDGNSIE